MADRTGQDTRDESALERVADIARELADTDGLDETLQRVVDLAMDYIEPCDGATLMVVNGGSVTTPASTGADANAADLAQFETGEGPCLSAMRDHETVTMEDIADDDRWPRWRDKVADLGWGSMIGLRLFVAEDTMGALDLYSRRPSAFDNHDEALARVFASHASVAMKAAISESGLQRALESRDIIGQAKGVLMERERLSGQQAFQRLVSISNDQNRKLREVARHIAETGALPD